MDTGFILDAKILIYYDCLTQLNSLRLGGKMSFTEKIRENNLNMKIIMITGYSNFEDEMDEKGLGINEVLMKPIPSEDLVKIIKKTFLMKEQ